MPKRTLVLLEGSTRVNGLLFVQAAKRLGLHPITLSADPAQYDYLAAERFETIRVDTGNPNALIRECLRLSANYDIVGVTSPLEAFYAIAGKLCRYFDLPGPDPASIERCRDKYAQRQLLAKAGVPMPDYRVAANAAEIESAASEIGWPVVVKPTVGNCSRGVRLCRTVRELTEHTTYLLGGKHIWQSTPNIVLVEEFAQGPQYIVHIMGNEVVAIAAAKFGRPPHFVFRKCIFPAPLTDDEHERIADVSLSCLRALGLGWGPINIELRWTKLGPVVIEVNPRIAGAPDSQLGQLAYGVDLVAEHIKLVTGEICNLHKIRSHTAAAAFLIPDCDGTVDWIDGVSRAAAMPGIAEVKLLIEPKMRIVRKGDDRDGIGWVIASSPSLDQTEAILQDAVDLIHWSITPFSILGRHE
ncbi:ATP-grasp domain-containing protein [Rhizobium azibense]|uniref:Biotin carboxylase n=1 Tax=Rhizobium azibense TaxID=1136135 RepID=A0A4R3R7S9_9HYPH|nr:acetyl-CoA carboxylase biotin carboxylase subunit family protein [Rhizobium azibense]TCU31308.1 biotin carboxylase [Rhizobium azibense]